MTLEMRGGTVPTTRKREGEKEAEKKKTPPRIFPSPEGLVLYDRVVSD